ncbi:CaiB/BaiF CoA transferase family protein [Chloroflexota bacterium]
MARKALSGIKVLEWAQMVAGPYCTKQLADMGAEVIKIEGPGKGDKARSREPFLNNVPHPERSGLFLYLNTNKRGITLDVKNPKGKKIFQELVKDVDIFVEDNPPKLMEELKLTYEELKEINPGLIMTSITPFGQTGPYRDYKAYPLNTFHSGGEGYVTPSASPSLDREPLTIGRYFGEYAVAIVSAGAILAALFAREATGSGQHIDISKQETLSYLAAWDIQNYARSGTVTTRETKIARMRAIYQCKDGYILFAPVGAKELEWWSLFFQALIYPEVDERFFDLNYLSENKRELAPLRRELLMKKTREEIFNTPQARECPLAPFLKPGEVVESEQIKHRGFFKEVDHPEAGRLKYPTTAYQFSKMPWEAERAAPLLGQHNEEIYCQQLGYSKEDLTKLREGEVI